MPDEKPEDKIAYDPTTDHKYLLQAKRMDLDSGWVGRIIGSAKNAPNNIAFLIVIMILFAGIIVIVAYPNDRIEFWSRIIRIITLTLGYLFGKNSNS